MGTIVLSQGPSAKLCRARPRGTLIAVNTMAAAWNADWWVFVDASTYLQVVPIGRPTVFCKAAVLTDLAEASPPALAELVVSRPRLHEGEATADDAHPRELRRLERLAELRARVPGWNRWSGTAALGLAISLGEGPLLLCGYDMHGDGDASGAVRVTRDESRWRQELEIFDRLLTIAKEEGLSPRHVREERDWE